MEVLNIELKPLTETSNLLVTLNSSVNVFIYIIFGEKFQKQFIQWVKSFWCCAAFAPSATPIQTTNNNLTATVRVPAFQQTLSSSGSLSWFAKCRNRLDR